MSRLGIIFIAVFLVFAATLTYAKSENGGQGNSGHGSQDSQKQSDERKANDISGKSFSDDDSLELAESSPAAISSDSARTNRGKNQAKSAVTPEASCDPSLEWNNHGEYVRCLAKLHMGGQFVSEGARSDVGKKHATGSGELNPSSSPVATDSANMSPSPEASGSALPEVSSSPEATDSGALLAPVQSLIDGITNLFEQFKALFSL